MNSAKKQKWCVLIIIKMKPVLLLTYFILAGLITVSQAHSGKIELLESQLQSLYLKHNHRISRQNLLRIQLDDMLKTIDSLKTNTDSDSDLLTKKMASALSISDSIESLEDQLRTINNRIAPAREQLYQWYSQKSDSLAKEMANTTLTTKREALREQYLIVTDKKMQLSPLPPALNFNPKKIREIRISANTNKLERDIYRNYLQLALANIDSHLVFIQNRENEISDQLKLLNKADLFMEDVLDSRLPEFYNQTQAGVNNRYGDNENFGAIANDEKSSMVGPIHPFISVYNNLHVLTASAQGSKADQIGSIETWDEYLEWIKEIREYFIEYRDVIVDKLNGAYINTEE